VLVNAYRSLLTKYFSGDRIEKNEWAGHVARMREGIIYWVLVGKPEGKSPLGRPRNRWKDNIKTDL
jgi:hypothetical protein